MITKGTTPTVTFKLEDDNGRTIDLSNYEVLIVTIEDSLKKQIDIDKSRFTFNDDYSFEATLTQDETLSLGSGRLKVQLRARSIENNAIASCEQYCTLAEILKKGVI